MPRAATRAPRRAAVTAKPVYIEDDDEGTASEPDDDASEFELSE